MRDVQWFVVATGDLPRISYAGGSKDSSPLQACALLDSALKAASVPMACPSTRPQDVARCCQTPGTAAAAKASQLLSLDGTPAVSSSNCMGSIAGSIQWQLQSTTGSGQAAPVCPNAPLRPRPRVALIPATELPLSLMQQPY